ncbi:prolipoprotein diacylglyceryl transferase [Candidatus Uhrbacteria bacterium]|nr:prolipoprotein diacylglyceryl transferase [Candidatus Uhrbacteria bacterium]
MISLLHTFHPSRILATVGGFTIYWYGLAYVVAIVAGLLLTRWLARKKNLDASWLVDLTTILFIAGIIGARLWYVLAIEPSYFLAHPLEAFMIWHGGLAIHGGIAGALVALWFWIRRHHLSFFDLTDLLVPALALGQAIGRWGNYFNQELFGRPTNLPWGIPIDPPNRIAPFTNAQYFHPTFLYESVGDLVIAIILIVSLRRFGAPGRTTFLYLALYALLRFGTEFIRIDPTPTFGGLRLPQWVSLAMIGGALLFFMYKRRHST